VFEETALKAEQVTLVGVYEFMRKNELIIAYHVRASGTVALSPELLEYRLVDPPLLRSVRAPAPATRWPTGCARAASISNSSSGQGSDGRAAARHAPPRRIAPCRTRARRHVILPLTITAMSDKPQRVARRYRHFLPITTRWMDNDVYGHVNNVVYYSYFDTVVNEYLIRAGARRRARRRSASWSRRSATTSRRSCFRSRSMPACGSRSSARRACATRSGCSRPERRRRPRRGISCT
jgi:hypothetical protein